MNSYEDPTVRLHSHTWSEEYKKNYDAIFGKKETWLERRERLKNAPESTESDLNKEEVPK